MASVDDPLSGLNPSPEGTSTILNSAVVSASISNLSVVDLEKPVVIRLKISDTVRVMLCF